MSHIDMGGGLLWPVPATTPPAAATAGEPLQIRPVSQVAVPGETIDIGGGSYLLELTDQTDTRLRRDVVDGQLDTAGLPLGRYSLTARRGTHMLPIGRLYLVETR